MIDVKGAVRNPGVYEMKAGDRVTQAIEKAGGLKKKADELNVNLAEQLQDGTIVYIPSEGEEGIIRKQQLVKRRMQLSISIRHLWTNFRRFPGWGRKSGSHYRLPRRKRKVSDC